MTSLNLALIISIGLLLLLLLLLLIALVIAVIARKRRRRQPKAVDDAFNSSTMTVSVVDAWKDGDIIAPSPTSGPTNQEQQHALKPEVADAVTHKPKSSITGGALSNESDNTPAASGNAQAPQPTPQSNGTVYSTSADPISGLDPERSRPSGPTGHYVSRPPIPDCEGRAWAPASHNVPTLVKRT